MGHRVDFRAKEVRVNAGDTGTYVVYGLGRLRPSGSGGRSEDVANSRVDNSPCFRIRLRCPRSDVSSPLCLSHLVVVVGLRALVSCYRMAHFNIVVICRGSGISITHA